MRRGVCSEKRLFRMTKFHGNKTSGLHDLVRISALSNSYEACSVKFMTLYNICYCQKLHVCEFNLCVCVHYQLLPNMLFI